MNEVYLAGRGMACALGDDLDSGLRSLRAGGVPPVDFEIAPGDSTPYFAIPPSSEDRSTRARRLVRAAAADSGALASRRGALFVATASIDMAMREQDHDLRFDIPRFAEQLADWLDWRGPVFTACTACTSSLNALHSASALVRSGDVTEALVLGIELSNTYTVAGFRSMQLLSASAARPLGAQRDGLVLGEAVAALHLSRRPSRWRLKGGTNLVAASNPTGADATTVAAMCRQVLDRGGLQAHDIDLIKLQAAGSPHNDAIEMAGLRRVFDPLPAVVSQKAWIGHTLGAAGAAEIALLTACIEADLWPAPRHALDPTLGVNWAVRAPQRLRHVLACILGFGGGHAAVVLEDMGAKS